MKAWQMMTPDSGLRLAEVPEPRLRGGGATLDVLAVQIPAYTDVLVAGGRGGFPTPIVLGPTGIGRVTATADDVFGVRQGDIVVATGLFRSGRTSDPEEALLGWTGIGGDGRATPVTDRMRAVWRDGMFAERAVLPERTLVALPGADAYPVERLAFLPWLGVAAEAVERAGVRAGQIVAVVGATGQLGGAAVLVALARGAAAVVAYGRNRESLDALAGLDPRVIPVPLTGNRGVDGQAIAAAGPIDAVVDALGAVPTPDPTMAGYDALRPDGTWVLVGGVRQNLPIPYGDFMHRRLTLRGSWMCRDTTLLTLWSMLRTGVLNLSPLNITTVSLDTPTTALTTAANSHSLTIAVLIP
ncbi:zinc-binding dehydrogenase [Nocardia terpenica]|uniref:zinc-binding dehydrogenase n=1 Tax=Nocardia terpenica TaxID=455432 RepID=UPI0018954CFB|nr:zinc-binding dehydrogenase [Nocardia terpenica]MBF6063683.1 zinc-binding dehydrogenase [Nocardia terpenica]MBF6107059.1 zinc-binding dehydrogenase [Nocardia terpenica]MBF6114232.1 zinc-binding dehydrogenase [Nocardia terpenica]MBF6121681.1 zinc-binding dehydrogenase [Nocardia terpenica]MBF6154096.1 zinc-binding dehydrogenase [Nocardia terpenica]